MHVREQTEITHKVIGNTSLTEVGIAGGYSKDWVATKHTVHDTFIYVILVIFIR